MPRAEDSRIAREPFIPSLHGECDVAAMVYGRSDVPDRILEEFIGELRDQGLNAIGLLQRRGRGAAGEQPFEHFLAPAALTEGTAPAGLALDELGNVLLRVLRLRPDLIVLNRFGWLEANGAGLLNVLGAAIDRDIPVLIAVPEALFERWLAVAQGLAVKVRCDPASLRQWWADLRRSPRTVENFCQDLR